MLGTLAYMAPEQADGLRPGPAADVYSLALTLYECFCGEHPLVSGEPGGDRARDRRADRPLSASAPDLPRAMTETIDAALDPDPELRPLASELEATLSGAAAELDGRRCRRCEGLDGTRTAPCSRGAARRLARTRRLGGRRPRPGRPDRDRRAGPLPSPPGSPACTRWAGRGPPTPSSWARSCSGCCSAPGSRAAALIASFSARPCSPADRPRGVPLPGPAPRSWGLAGLGPVYPALAGLTRGAGGRALWAGRLPLAGRLGGARPPDLLLGRSPAARRLAGVRRARLTT